MYQCIFWVTSLHVFSHHLTGTMAQDSNCAYSCKFLLSLFFCLFSKDLCECLWQKHHKTPVLVVVCICSNWDGTTRVKNRNILIQQQHTHFDGVWLTSGLIEDLCLPLWEGELFHVPVSPHHVAVRAGSEDTAGELAHWHHHHPSPLLKTPVCMEPLETIMSGLFVSLWHLAFNSSGHINQPNEQSRNINELSFIKMSHSSPGNHLYQAKMAVAWNKAPLPL